MIFFQQWSILAVGIVLITSTVLVLTQNWRIYIASLVVQYLAIFWLVALVQPLGLAAVKLIVGWMAGAILGSSQPVFDIIYGSGKRLTGTLFRTLSAVVVWMLCFSAAPFIKSWLPASDPILWSGTILIGMGLLQLGMTNRPLRAIVGLLTVLSGFEMLYAVVETSILVSGLLALINLGLAFVGGGFLVFSQNNEETT